MAEVKTKNDVQVIDGVATLMDIKLEGDVKCVFEYAKENNIPHYVAITKKGDRYILNNIGRVTQVASGVVGNNQFYVAPSFVKEVISEDVAIDPELDAEKSKEIAALEQQIVESQKKLTEFMSSIAEYKKINTALEMENDRLKTEVNNLQEKIKVANVHEESINQYNKNLEEQNGNLQKKIDELEQEISSLEEKVEELNERELTSDEVISFVQENGWELIIK